MRGKGTPTDTLAELIRRTWPNYLLISRKPSNREAALIDRRSGVTVLSAPSNALLAEALKDPEVARRLSAPPTGFGLCQGTFDEFHQTALAKLEDQINWAFREAEEWANGKPVGLTQGQGGWWEITVDGKPVGRIPR